MGLGLFALVGLVCSVWLATIGFQGNLKSWEAGVPWAYLGVLNLIQVINSFGG